ncbi:MAG: PTS sugar transporter subunit IIA [Anaerostipes sp.]|jgi:PTS system galactitol-specific IIA component
MSIAGELIKKEYIYENLSVKNQDEVFEVMGGQLVEDGIAKESYVQALKDREAVFPTGLPTAGITIAMPHTDSNHVNEGCISIAKLQNPVSFHEMGNKKKTLDVEMIFMLALNDPTMHLKMLQKIIGMFSDKAVLNELKDAKTSEEIYKVVKKAADV